jgi:hypothetical protein
MSFYDLFAWFCKNHGVLNCSKTDGKRISARVGKVRASANLVGVVDSAEFGAEVATLLSDLHAAHTARLRRDEEHLGR